MHFAPFAALVVALSLSAYTVRADDKSVVAAASAFEQGQQAELSGNFDRAAELFELADRIAPTPEALRSATRARLAADQLPAAAGNAEELLRRYSDDSASRELAEKALLRARPELTRFTFQCSEPCTVVVDGLATGMLPLKTQVVYVTPGSHNIVLGFDGDLTRGLRLQGSAAEQRVIKVGRPVGEVARPGAAASSAPTASAGSEATQRDEGARRGLPSGYFWTAASLTVVVGALTLWSGLDLLNARDDFKARAMPTQSQFEDGESKDTRTSVLLGTTGALLVGTVVLGAFTHFGGKAKSAQRASVHLDGRGASLRLSGSF